MQIPATLMNEPDYYYCERKVFDEVKMDAFFKGFWFGILFSLAIGLVFVVGMTFGK